MWGPPVPHAEPALPLRDEIRAGLTTAALVAMLGAPVGLLWAAVAPKVLIERTPDGLALASSETKSFVGADGWFLVIALLAGLACGVAAWRLGRRPQLGTSLGLMAGSLVAALIAWRVGHLVDVPRLSALLHTLPGKPIIDPTLDLRAKGVLFAWPVSAVAAFSILLTLRPGR
ncbi:MAG: hypothetical protein QOG53_2275 [Frankiales bacterium]|nr:hypothetical protein [Frankiales bacterium]